MSARITISRCRYDQPAFPLATELSCAEDFARTDLSRVLEPGQVELMLGQMKDHGGRGLIRYGVQVGVVSSYWMTHQIGGAA